MSKLHELSDDWHTIRGISEDVYIGTQLYSSGWVNDEEAVNEITSAWEARGMRSIFSSAAPRLMKDVDDDSPVFFWDAETKVLGKNLRTWNQNPVGSCVGFGFTRCAQDLLLWEIASGENERWPNSELAPEVTYGGSRVEVGGGRIRGDGSIGAWAAEFLMKWGVVRRDIYGSLDLTQYDPTICRKLGKDGLPTSLEEIARLHPVRAAAKVTTRQETWAAIGGGKPVSVCSDRGFSMRLQSDGYCDVEGEWMHCMGIRGRFKHPRKGRSFVIGNSWDNYLRDNGTEVQYIDTDGKTKVFMLPKGCFCTTWEVVGSMVAQGDSFALAGLTGWEKTTVDYTP